jgi:hypothetical protein
MDTGMAEATKRVVAAHLNMFKESCVVSAVEAWRIWNDFPEQQHSVEFARVFTHFGNMQAVFSDITFIMSRLAASPSGTLDDSILLQEVATGRVGAPQSNFLKMYVHAALLQKYGSDVLSSMYGQAHTRNAYSYGCSHCGSIQFVKDMEAYVARRRMSAL